MSEVIAIQSLGLNEPDFSPYGIATSLFCGRHVRDRFNFLNAYSQVNWATTVDPIPEPSSIPLSELMDRRAQELISKGKVAAQWSGGVDSTSLLLALIKNGIKKENLEILLDKNSILEYPKLYSWLSEQGYTCILVKNWKNCLGTCTADVITNGWCADQLFGSIFFHEAPELYDKKLEDLISTIHLPFGKASREQANEAVEVFKRMGKDLFDVDISIAAHLGWMINFCLKWTWVSSFNELFLVGTKNQFKTSVFYNTPYFQSWAINNFLNISQNNIYGKEAKYYKRELKEYCNSVFEDENYLLNKSKVPSWNAALTPKISVPLETYNALTIKTTTGYELYKLPIRGLHQRYELITKEIFTKYCK